MGYGRWSSDAWDRYAARNINGKRTVDDIYTQRGMDASLDPKGVRVRESLDSRDNPESTPVIVGLDVTGSMGFVLDSMAREGLKKLATEIYDKRPISDPHLMFMGIGDVKFDRAPLQVTQFEADIRIAEQLTKIYLERGGGGNNCESYTLPWWFAAMHTKCDAYRKRNKKGYLFTMGDECPPKELSASDIEKALGYTPQFDRISTKKLYELVARQYEVFHIVVEEGSYCSYGHDRVLKEWREVLGQHVLVLSDHTKMAELIVSTLQVMNGEEREEVVKGYDECTALVIQDAMRELSGPEKRERGFLKFFR